MLHRLVHLGRYASLQLSHIVSSIFDGSEAWLTQRDPIVFSSFHVYRFDALFNDRLGESRFERIDAIIDGLRQTMLYYRLRQQRAHLFNSDGLVGEGASCMCHEQCETASLPLSCGERQKTRIDENWDFPICAHSSLSINMQQKDP